MNFVSLQGGFLCFESSVDPPSASLQCYPHRFHQFRYELVYIHIFLVDLNFILFECGNLKHLFHLFFQAFVFLFDDAAVAFPAFGVIGYFIASQHLGRYGNG